MCVLECMWGKKGGGGVGGGGGGGGGGGAGDARTRSCSLRSYAAGEARFGAAPTQRHMNI